MTAQNWRRKSAFRLIALGLGVAFIELASAVAIERLPYPRIERARALYAEQSAQIREFLDRSVPHHVEIDPDLGWRHTPKFTGALNRMNSAGLRGSSEYSGSAGPGVLRVAAFGDSFVYGAEVDNATSWAGRIEHENPGLEVLNYGVAGYGVDQAYLRYVRDGTAFLPHVVIMGFVPDDLNRTTNIYRRFLSSGAALFKPRFVLTERGELALREVPLKTVADYENLLANPRQIITIGRGDYWYPACVYENPLHDYFASIRVACAAGGQVYRRYLDHDRPVKGGYFNEGSSAFKIQVKLFEEFVALARRRGSVPLIVLLPDAKALDRIRRDQAPVYEPLIGHLRSRGLPFADAADAFRQADLPEGQSLFALGGHYSADGNRLVAAWLVGRLHDIATRISRGGREPSGFARQH